MSANAKPGRAKAWAANSQTGLQRSAGARIAVEAQTPEKGGRVAERVQRRRQRGPGRDAVLVDAARAVVSAPRQLEQGQVPGQVAVQRARALVRGQPALEIGGAALDITRLVGDVGEPVRDVGASRLPRARLLHQSAGFRRAARFVVGPAMGKGKPPVAGIVRRQRFEEREEHRVVVGTPAERDEAEGPHRQREDEGVARELGHVRAHRGQRARRVAVEQGADGLHVLALPPRDAAGEAAGACACRLGLGDAAADLQGAREPGGGEGEAGVGLERGFEGGLRAGGGEKDVVHARPIRVHRAGGDGRQARNRSGPRAPPVRPRRPARGPAAPDGGRGPPAPRPRRARAG